MLLPAAVSFSTSPDVASPRSMLLSVTFTLNLYSVVPHFSTISTFPCSRKRFWYVCTVLGTLTVCVLMPSRHTLTVAGVAVGS